MAIAISDVKARHETDLDDPTLQRIVDAAVRAVERAAGSATSETSNFIDVRHPWFSVHRPAVTITSITERITHTSDAVVLSTNDYRQVGDYRFLRLKDGTNPARFWGDEVAIVFVPLVDQDIRDRVATDLCIVDIEFRAYDAEKSGDWSGSQKDWVSRRRALLAHVREGRSPIV